MAVLRQTLLGLWPIIPLFQFGAAPPLRYNQPPANQLVSNVSMTKAMAILCDVAHFAPGALIMSMYVSWQTGRTRECTPTLCHPTNPRSTCRYVAWVPGKWDRLYSAARAAANASPRTHVGHSGIARSHLHTICNISPTHNQRDLVWGHEGSFPCRLARFVLAGLKSFSET